MISRFVGSYRFLSNFYAAPVRLDGESYPTVEHAYQAAKTHDTGWRLRIRMASAPGAAKRFGRALPLRDDWEQIKLDVMVELLRQKFAAPTLKAMLRTTGEQSLIEGNTWHDNFWGSCACTRCGNRGENHLGKLLMQVRAELRESEGGAP